MRRLTGVGRWRGWPRSLGGRLAAVIAATQSAVVLAGMAAWMLASPYVSWEDVAGESASALIIASLAAGATDGAVVVQTPALAAYAAARPTLRWAVWQGGHVLDGASPDLAAAIATFGPRIPREGRLAMDLPGGDLAAFRPAQTPFGPVVVVTAGNRFRPGDDLGTFFTDYAVMLVPMFGPALLAAVLIMPLAIHRILRPLRDAAAEAEEIDLRSLDRRLDGAATPNELRPFLLAINRLLARIEEGVQRQRVFTANAAHELRTPVAILQARIDGLPPGAPGRVELARDVRRITLLLDQLLAAARLGQLSPPQAEAVGLAALARRVAADLAPLAIQAGRAVAVEVEGDPGAVHGHAAALGSALANLLDNALRAEPPGGTVIIAVGPGARIAVIDHGPGIAPEDQPFLFEPFWRKDEACVGTGLGLAIVRDISNLHGGSVSVEDTPRGGATFVLAFPTAPASRQPGARMA